MITCCGIGHGPVVHCGMNEWREGGRNERKKEGMNE
jgi:hypothetical protein